MNQDKAITMMLLGGLLFGVAWMNPAWAIHLVWLAVNFVAVSSAYYAGNPKFFGKRPDGTLAWWGRVFFLPYRLYSWLVWKLWSISTSEPATNQVNNQLSVGRMQTDLEVMDGFANYVDLTAEFQEAPKARNMPGYVSFPVLDGTAPPSESLHRVIGSLRPGHTFVHCAQGHGRTGLFAAAFLLHTKAASSIDDALKILKAVRPGIGLNASQSKCLAEFAETWRRGEVAA